MRNGDRAMRTRYNEGMMINDSPTAASIARATWIDDRARFILNELAQREDWDLANDLDRCYAYCCIEAEAKYHEPNLIATAIELLSRCCTIAFLETE